MERKDKIMFTKEDIHNKLESVGYCSNSKIDSALMVAMAINKPLLIEGEPGIGKTSLAKALGKALDIPVIRVQMYDGLTDDKILYDYNYQKQLLTLEAVKPTLEKELKDLSAKEAIKKIGSELDFYGPDFMIDRPVLRAINGSGRKILLFDEIDKASEEIEYMLYEFLEDYSITIPEYGKITCPEDQRPIVFLTSNNYRELSQALKRRCSYLFLEAKTYEEIIEILKTSVDADNDVAKGVAMCIDKANKVDAVRQKPSIAEGIEWAAFLSQNKENIDRQMVFDSLNVMIKNHKDEAAMRKIVLENCSILWGE